MEPPHCTRYVNVSMTLIQFNCTTLLLLEDENSIYNRVNCNLTI